LRATLWLKAGDDKKSRADREKVAQLASSRPIDGLQVGLDLLAGGQFNEAIAEFTKSIESKPSRLAYEKRALAWSFKSNLAKATADLSRAIELEPQVAMLYVHRAATELLQGKLDMALTDVNKALEIDPKLYGGYGTRGVVWFRLGKYEKAQADLERAIELKPTLTLALSTLARLLATCPNDKLRNGKQAVALATKACELTNWRVWQIGASRAAAAAEVGDFANAVVWQRRSIALRITTPAYVKPVLDLPDDRQILKLYQAKKPLRFQPK